MAYLIALVIFMVVDAVATYALFNAARKNPKLSARIDAAFGRLINRRQAAGQASDTNCPFCE